MSSVREGGYHYRFVKEDEILDMLVCKIYQDVSRDPYETKCCNNTFCKSCIDKSCAKWKKRCPICRSLLKTAEAVQIRRSIKQLDVYCEYVKDGCKWIGQVEAIEKHLKECRYKPTPCEYHIIGCKAKVTRGRQIEHNQKDKKKHFKLVLDCVKKLKDTQQQLNDTQQQLEDSEDKLIRQKNTDALNFAVKLSNANVMLADTRRELAMAKTLKAHILKVEWLIIIFLVVSCFILMMALVATNEDSWM